MHRGVLKVGDCFAPLTVQRIREEFTTPQHYLCIPVLVLQSNASCLRITAMAGEDFHVAEEDPDIDDPEAWWCDITSMDTFTPNGSLITRASPWSFHESGMTPYWLGTAQRNGGDGPYQAGQTSPCFFLAGDGTGDLSDVTEVQINAGPPPLCNALSLDPLDSVTLYALQTKK